MPAVTYKVAVMTSVRTRAWLPAATVAVLLATSAAASAQSTPAPQPAPAPSAAEQASMQAFGESDKQCAAWTDECRICRRTGDQVACSNIGIACQPKDIRCTARAPAPAPEKAQ